MSGYKFLKTELRLRLMYVIMAFVHEMVIKDTLQKDIA